MESHLPSLQALARYKYDEYVRFEPGRRFIESLATWLAQFDTKAERTVALSVLRRRLVFVSEREMRHLVRSLYEHHLKPALRERVAEQIGVPGYAVRQIESSKKFQELGQRTLYLALSDGARIDELRRSTRGLGNEQVFQTYQVSAEKFNDMRKALRRELDALGSDAPDTFQSVVLVDDFAGSGKSILRTTPKGDSTGRLQNFADIMTMNPDLFDGDNTSVTICLLIATSQAEAHLRASLESFPSPPWADMPRVVIVQRLRPGERIDDDSEPEFAATLRARYRREVLFDKNKAVGGDSDSYIFGFGACGLMLVLPHNTPNNSVYLLHEERGNYVALFPRADRFMQ